MRTTTVRIYPEENDWIDSCMQKLEIKSRPEFFKKLREAVVLKQKEIFYNSLPQIGKRKPLKGRCIPKQCTAYH